MPLCVKQFPSNMLLTTHFIHSLKNT